MRDTSSEDMVYAFSGKLATLRKEAGLSIEGLAHLTGLSTSTLSELENKKSFPNLLTCIKICRALKVKPSSIFKTIED